MKIYSLAVLSLLIASTSLYSYSESLHPALDNKHTIIVGAYRQDADAGVFSKQTDRQKTTIDSDNLGLEDSDTNWMMEYRYRLTDKWVFSVGAYAYDNSGSISAIHDFNFDDVEFEAGTKVDTTTEFDTLIFDALYRVYDSDRAEIFVGGGIHFVNINISIDALLSAGDKEQKGSRATDDLLAPLPNLRVWGFYAFNPKWALMTTLGWLSFNIDDYEGGFSYVHVRTTYRFSERWGAGLGYQYIDMDFTRKNSSGEAGIDAQFSGPSIFLSYNF